MRGEMTIDFRRDPRPQRKAKKGAHGMGRKKGAIRLEKPEDQELFEALRQLRLELARRQKVPPYVVFSDRTLIEMAVARPGSETALREVHGVGDAKLERYGQVFLERISEHVR